MTQKIGTIMCTERVLLGVRGSIIEAEAIANGADVFVRDIVVDAMKVRVFVVIATVTRATHRFDGAGKCVRCAVTREEVSASRTRRGTGPRRDDSWRPSARGA